MTLGGLLERDRLAARVKRLERVILSLRRRSEEAGRSLEPIPIALKQAIADFERELNDLRRRLRVLEAPAEEPDASSAAGSGE